MNATGPRSPAGMRPDLWRAVVRPEELAESVVQKMLVPEGVLEGWVEQIWSLAWNHPVPADLSSVISHPTAQFTVESGPAGEVRHGRPLPDALLHGVTTRRFGLDLPSHGWVVGLHLVPGALGDLLAGPASDWTDRVVPWAQAWPGWDFTSVWESPGPEERARALSALAQTKFGPKVVSADGQLARDFERLVREDSSVRTVEDAAHLLGLSPRSLQRLSRRHLGVTPRWLLRRARVLDAHEWLAGTDLELTDIAQQLGWYDQAHFTRDYTRIVGTSPGRLRRERALEKGNGVAGRSSE